MILVDTEGELVELGGDHDPSRMSVPFSMWDGGAFFENRPVSYAKIFASQPAVAIVVMRLLTWSVRVPLKVYRRTDSEGGRERLRPGDHPLARAVVSPWDRGCMADLVTGLLGSLSVQGNSLTDVVEGAGGQIRFEGIDWRTVSPIRADDSDPNAEILGWKVYNPDGTHERSADTVMHLRWWSPLGKLGISPLRQLGSTIITEEAAIKWTLNSLQQSARPHGVVELTDAALSLEAEKRQQLYNQHVEDLRTAYSGPENAGKLPVLPPGLKWTNADQTTAVEAELMAQRKANRTEAASIFMVPAPSVGVLDRANFSNVYTLREMAYTDGLAPPLILGEQTINAHVVQGLLREDDVFVEFDFAGILRPDRLKEIQALREAIGSALLMPNEGRDVLNLPRVPAEQANKLYLPRNNLQPLEDADAADIGDKSLAAQRLGQAVKSGLISREEGRELIGLDGDLPDGDEDDDPEGDTAALAETNGHQEVEA